MTAKAQRFRRRSGATLLEVMVALGILATTYVALLDVHGGAIRLSAYSREVTVGTFLARQLMEQTLEKLETEGFPDMDEDEEGDFEDEGFPSYAWQVHISKPEIPLEAIEKLASGFLGGEESDEGGGGILGQLGDNEQIAQMIGGLGVGQGKGGNALIPSSMDQLRQMAEPFIQQLQESIREVRVKVAWGEQPGDSVELVTHAVRVPRASAGAGTAPQPGAAPGLPPGAMAPGGRRPGGFSPSRINPGLPGGMLRT
ncbi:MAG: hypothetical protein D6806_13900, partial [Deltaproteobacteria bacterium]